MRDIYNPLILFCSAFKFDDSVSIRRTGKDGPGEDGGSQKLEMQAFLNIFSFQKKINTARQESAYASEAEII